VADTGHLPVPNSCLQAKDQAPVPDRRRAVEHVVGGCPVCQTRGIGACLPRGHHRRGEPLAGRWGENPGRGIHDHHVAGSDIRSGTVARSPDRQRRDVLATRPDRDRGRQVVPDLQAVPIRLRPARLAGVLADGEQLGEHGHGGPVGDGKHLPRHRRQVPDQADGLGRISSHGVPDDDPDRGLILQRLGQPQVQLRVRSQVITGPRPVPRIGQLGPLVEQVLGSKTPGGADQSPGTRKLTVPPENWATASSHKTDPDQGFTPPRSSQSCGGSGQRLRRRVSIRPAASLRAGRGPRLPGTCGDPRVCGWRPACRLAPTW
jgi:hypothetical protein